MYFSLRERALRERSISESSVADSPVTIRPKKSHGIPSTCLISKAFASLDDQNKPPITSDEMLELATLDLETALTTLDCNLIRDSEEFTVIRFKSKVDEIIAKLEAYAADLRNAQNYVQ